MPPSVAAVFAGYPDDARRRLEAVRALIFDTAAATPGVGALTEALRWGEPAYLTLGSRSGSTLRLGWSAAAPARCAVYFNCKTRLVESFRAAFPGVFAFEGDRALLLDARGTLPEAALAQCLAAALTYHQRKRATRAA